MKSIDFEFFNSNEPHPTLVCAAMDGKTYWLLDGQDSSLLVRDIISNSNQFLGYYTVAEARCFLALGLDPLKFQWIDLYAEFKMQQNSNNKFQYGQFIDKDGSLKFSEPPNYGEDNEETNSRKVPSNLINAVYKNTGRIISSREKEEVRDIILSKNTDIINRNRERILKYCLEDTNHLQELYDKICSHYSKEGLKNFHKDMLSRGAYTAAIAKCEQIGIPIDIELLNKIIEKTPDILKMSQDNVNQYIPIFKDAYTPPPKTYKNGNVHHYKEHPACKDTKALQRFIRELEIPDWPKTGKWDFGANKPSESEGKTFSTKKETLETYRYIPAIEILYQHNKTESSLKWFNKENGDGFFEAFGSDNNVRPFYGVFGTQTGRNAAKAKTFPLAMSSWLRAIIRPTEGEYIIAADFSQQEVAVAAALSGDRNLRLAYESGDTYLAFAKLAGAIPETATKDTHKPERGKFKATKLGIQFGMGKYLLQKKLSYDCGRPFILEEAVELINHHKRVFPEYWKYVQDISDMYQRGYPIITNGGFVLWQDNPRMTSVRNSPIQGTSADITREATVDAWLAELKVMCQLHDAIYVRSTNPTVDISTIISVMNEAVKKILGPGSIDIRIDVKVIGHDMTWDILSNGTWRETGRYWVEEKGEKEWNKIKEFLTD